MCAVAAAVACLVAGVARAELSPIVFELHAANQGGSGTYQVLFEDGDYDPETGFYFWKLSEPIVIEDELSLAPIAMLWGASVSFFDDPEVNLGFDVEAGSTETIFTITSALVGFPAIDPAEGRASAALTVTDTDGDGATLTGQGPRGGAYLAQYNGMVPGGETFAELIDSLIAPGGRSAAVAASFPGGGDFSPIPLPVVDMSAEFKFTLTANDLASGTSHFEIVPEPGAIGLLLVGLGVAVRRRSQDSGVRKPLTPDS